MTSFKFSTKKIIYLKFQIILRFNLKFSLYNELKYLFFTQISE